MAQRWPTQWQQGPFACPTAHYLQKLHTGLLHNLLDHMLALPATANSRHTDASSMHTSPSP